MGESNGKPGRVDLVVKDTHLGGFRDLVVDVVCTHEFGGSHLADVSLNYQLCDHNPLTPTWTKERTLACTYAPSPNYTRISVQ